MARGQSRRKPLSVPGAEDALNKLKYEIAAELGIPVGPQLSNLSADAEFATELGSIPAASIREDYWGHVASRDAGAVGGHLVRRLVQQAELAMGQLQ
jgi:hypothetical protein